MCEGVLPIRAALEMSQSGVFRARAGGSGFGGSKNILEEFGQRVVESGPQAPLK